MQCRAAEAAGNNFWQQPVHCQQAQIQNLNFSLEGLLSAHTENNLNRLAQPLATVTIGTAINLRPTIKPDGSANMSGSAVVPSTSQPDDGSAETTLLNSGGTAENAYVTVGISFGNSHGPSLDERFVDASQWGQPQTDFKYGDHGAGFNDKEKTALKEAFNIINREGCKNWINKTLKRMQEIGGRSIKGFKLAYTNVDDLLAHAELNKYSSSLTAEKMGVNSKTYDRFHSNEVPLWGWLPLANGFRAVTVGNSLWFHDLAFRTQNYPGYQDAANLPGIIVHELFHVAGLFGIGEAADKGAHRLIDNKQIRQHCGGGLGGQIGGEDYNRPYTE